MPALIRLGIVGYGNLGRGVELAARQNPDLKVAAVFTRRDPRSVKAAAPVKAMDALAGFRKKLDALILCGGSATDLPAQGPALAAQFNTIDSFDTHAHIPAYFKAVDAAARKAQTLSLISAGWDPGLFSLNRLIAQAVLPAGVDYTFWGPGVSQGHSDAIRRVPGVAHGIQYTLPVASALARVRAGREPDLTTRQKHRRVCYVVPEPGADRKAITRAIRTMPNYFADYDTTVHFITAAELKRKHAGLPHGGFVLRAGRTGKATRQLIEFRLQLGSNPEFTASVLVACARAVVRLRREGRTGAITMFDVPPAYYASHSAEDLRRELL